MKEHKRKSIEDFVRKFIGQDKLLWYDKPLLIQMFKHEAKYYIGLFIFIPLSMLFLSIPEFNIKWLLIKMAIASPIYVIIICRIFEWFFRKKNTYFILTDIQAIIVYRKDGKWIELSKAFDEIWHCDIQKYHNGCTIYVGKYRFNNSNPYNYATRKLDNIEYSKNFLRNQFIQYIYSLDYFAFFDLEDCTLPVQIIRDQMMINKKKEERNIDT